MNGWVASAAMGTVLASAGLARGEAAAPAAPVAEVTASVDVLSAYVFRGTTLNDGPVIQPGMDVYGLPVTIGVWANYDLDAYANDPTILKQDFSEIDFYLTYVVPQSVKQLALSANYYVYSYPGRALESDDWVTLKVAGECRLSPSLEVFYGVDGAVEQSVYVEVNAEHSHKLDDDWMLKGEVGVGYIASHDAEDGFTHAAVTAKVGYKWFYAAVTYIAQLDDDVVPDVERPEDGLGYDVSVVGTVGASYDF